MGPFSRIGMIASMAGLVSTSGAWMQPATGDIPTLTSVIDGQSLNITEPTGRFLALHVLDHPDSTECRRFVREFLARAPQVAGLRHIFSASAPPDGLKSWAQSFGSGEGSFYADERARFAMSLGLAAGGAVAAPATIVFDPTGREVLRVLGAGPHDHLRFDEFAARVTEVTKRAATDEYNLPKGSSLAVQGYDVVSYIDDNRAQKGKPELESTYLGVRYRFASEEHRARFAADPQRYLPTYGGWCASAMGAKGTKVEIDPRNFKVKDGRLFLFYKSLFADALDDWNRHEQEWEPAADTNWKKQTGEDPIRPAK